MNLQILGDFDNYLMDNAGHVAANNDENVVYDNQPNFEEPIQDKQNFGLDDWVCLCYLKHCYLLWIVHAKNYVLLFALCCLCKTLCMFVVLELKSWY